LAALKGKKPKVDVSKLPVAIQFVLKFVEEEMVDEFLHIPIDDQIFGYHFNFYMMKDSIKQLCQMEELALSIITGYIAYVQLTNLISINNLL